MKKIVLLLLFMVFSLNLALAGDKLDIDLINKNFERITIAEKDAVVFDFFVRDYNKKDIIKGNPSVKYEAVAEEQVVMLRELVPERNFARLTIFIEGAEVPQYVDLPLERILNLDFDRDEVDDVFIQIERMDDFSATLLFARNDDEGSPDLSFYQNLYANEVKDGSSYFTLTNFIYLILIIFLLILISNTRYVRRKYMRLKRRS